METWPQQCKHFLESLPACQTAVITSPKPHLIKCPLPAPSPPKSNKLPAPSQAPPLSSLSRRPSLSLTHMLVDKVADVCVVAAGWRLGAAPRELLAAPRRETGSWCSTQRRRQFYSQFYSQHTEDRSDDSSTHWSPSWHSQAGKEATPGVFIQVLGKAWAQWDVD